MISVSNPKLSFDRFRFTYADSRATVFSTFRPDIESLTFERLQADFEAHRNAHKLAYERLKYDWCLEPKNYDYPIEMYLQLKLLRILATVHPSRINYDRLSNLCVRVVPLCDGSVRTTTIDQWKYIIFSSSYLQLIDELFLYIRSLAAIGFDMRHLT